MLFDVILNRQETAWVRFVDMQDQWAELSEIEARVTAQDRLDLHYEHRDAVDVERGSWRLLDYLRSFSEVHVRVGDHSVRGQIVSVGPDWVQLPSALVAIHACEIVIPDGSAQAEANRLQFRQAVRQLAGRAAREMILRNGRSYLVGIDWVAEDFVHIRLDGRPAVIPLGQIAVVFGRVEVG